MHCTETNHVPRFCARSDWMIHREAKYFPCEIVLSLVQVLELSVNKLKTTLGKLIDAAVRTVKALHTIIFLLHTIRIKNEVKGCPHDPHV